MELILRMHRVLFDKKKPYRMLFLPDPICWTQVPEDLKSLGKQRRRWQRGLAESLMNNRRLCFNRRYGWVGILGFPFFVFCELLSPAIELIGYCIVATAIVADAIDWRLAVSYLICAMLLGTILSMSSLLLEAIAFRKYPSIRDTLVLAAYAVMESFGYRQLHGFWRCRGLADFVAKRGSWGQPVRRAF
jgi:cellulose synthase/poly-beta-1,6-N-acetylglucosamine synthase-like glycosyltransferase